MHRLVAAVAIALLMAHGVAFAATAAVTPPKLDALQAAPPPPYDDDLLRLSEILGAIHYLRQLCGSDEGNVWREQMEKLLESENPDEARRARLVDRFNRGYDGYKSVYLSCTPAASEASERYLEEGAKIAAEITARYGR